MKGIGYKIMGATVESSILPEKFIGVPYGWCNYS